VGTVTRDYCMDYQNNLPIFVGHAPRQPLAAVWPRLKHHD
jgi:hypothetical protein